MKKVVNYWLLLLILSTVALASTTTESSNSFPSICDAFDESSEEKCVNVNDGYIGPLQAQKTPPFKVRYLLYKNPKNTDEYHEIFLNNKESVLKANPYPKEKAMWKILVHGFTNNKDSQFPLNVKEAYLKHLECYPNETINILVFDWGDGAKSDLWSIFKRKGVYQNAVENVEIAGRMLGDMITYLHNEGFLNITTGTHLIGHSLGSHVSGQATRRVYDLSPAEEKLLVWRVSALDPAVMTLDTLNHCNALYNCPLFWRNSILFWLHDPYPRLHRSRASFLDVYHTSNLYGSNQEMGDVDFFINGGEVQPMCKGIINQIKTRRFTQSCSHQFAPEIFAKSINNKAMKACTGCFSYGEYHGKKCECEDTPILGEYVVEETYYGYPLASGQAFYDIKDLGPKPKKCIDILEV